jgi:hypothetical protein
MDKVEASLDLILRYLKTYQSTIDKKDECKEEVVMVWLLSHKVGY